jgi:hypothetical protein
MDKSMVLVEGKHSVTLLKQEKYELSKLSTTELLSKETDGKMYITKELINRFTRALF